MSKNWPNVKVRVKAVVFKNEMAKLGMLRSDHVGSARISFDATRLPEGDATKNLIASGLGLGIKPRGVARCAFLDVEV